ncbi:methyltransferase domain-containing protein [Candidatus Pandoraea novymonadis]|uniref:Malonyl-[acyl-carrier protein] O-methyltransferase n=1 Tax=Candidatus Pandoraea novymonadis TaxID=1808959 RepID=A0ABX5FDH3_9BURK|nr:methyltransferase domain-containing protein [Candidatus Pandoraea novymonadis]PSB91751.1 Malonyl-[acyl-carrier protein] O-methyltransferase [Candidatus Pandoraea novymonadis]
MNKIEVKSGTSFFSSRFLRAVFDRRALHWADADFLMREIAERLASRLDYIKIQPRRLLDAGCSTGADLLTLGARYPQAYRIGLDLSEAMTNAAASKCCRTGWHMLQTTHGPGIIQGDFSKIPLRNSSVDLLWSNLALHWYQEPHRVIPEWHRVLTNNGLLMFSAFGPDTLRELRAAWKEVSAFPQLELMPTDMHDLGDMLVQSHFDTPVVDMESITMTFETPQALLRDVRLLGVNLQPMLSVSLTGKQYYSSLLAALERQRRADGTLMLTFEIIYGHAWKVASRTDATGNAVIRVQDIQRDGRRYHT